ncbi:hypothetical protein HPB48_017861 [Haemaphysalis longicornis]|uniref:Uncharacterized protein n=1 Tax=Haemaphysalis longicornis TaxID=44386 RepID=A0A9J6GQ75_HAELO|nr:hypothetical protein HPB48_017861 [Haemaphysalis longicornis]
MTATNLYLLLRKEPQCTIQECSRCCVPPESLSAHVLATRGGAAAGDAAEQRRWFVESPERTKRSPTGARKPSRDAEESVYAKMSPKAATVPNVEFFPRNDMNGPNGNTMLVSSYARIPVPVLEEFCFTSKEYCGPGDPGQPGKPGIPGYPGEKGDTGLRGLPGVPGNPGPVGPVGPPGFKGDKGSLGETGPAGLDGRDGLPGQPGLDGIPGPQGPDGRPGVDGRDGEDGIPGRNGTDGIDVPPSIVDTHTVQTVTIREGENVRLRCSATGQPEPLVTWRREDGSPIYGERFHESLVEDRQLNLTHVTREEMGRYLCTASNGVPVEATKEVLLEVTFPPFIRIKQWSVGTRLGGWALLECHVESFPAAVNTWTLRSGRFLEDGAKYRIREQDRGYATIMTLNVTRVEQQDFGLYHCVSKNALGQAIGSLTVYKCLVTRRVIERVGKPVLNRKPGGHFSNWMRESTPFEPNTFYVANEQDESSLLEFPSKAAFQNGSGYRTLRLPVPFHGNGQVLYNGSLYYHQNDTNYVVRVPLSTRGSGETLQVAARLKLDDAVYRNGSYLYAALRNYVNFLADENGLWISYSSRRSNNTMILKVHEESLRPEYIWNLTVDHRQVAHLFVVCGVLYAVNSQSEHTTDLGLAYDLYSGSLLTDAPRLNFSNPFGNTTFLAYNPGDASLYTTDSGNQLIYPLLFNFTESTTKANALSS